MFANPLGLDRTGRQRIDFKKRYTFHGSQYLDHVYGLDTATMFSGNMGGRPPTISELCGSDVKFLPMNYEWDGYQFEVGVIMITKLLWRDVTLPR